MLVAFKIDTVKQKIPVIMLEELKYIKHIGMIFNKNTCLSLSNKALWLSALKIMKRVLYGEN